MSGGIYKLKGFEKVKECRRRQARLVTVREINDVIDEAVEADREALVARHDKNSCCHMEVVEALEALRKKLCT